MLQCFGTTTKISRGGEPAGARDSAAHNSSACCSRAPGVRVNTNHFMQSLRLTELACLVRIRLRRYPVTPFLSHHHGTAARSAASGAPPHSSPWLLFAARRPEHCSWTSLVTRSSATTRERSSTPLSKGKMSLSSCRQVSLTSCTRPRSCLALPSAALISANHSRCRNQQARAHICSTSGLLVGRRLRCPLAQPFPYSFRNRNRPHPNLYPFRPSLPVRLVVPSYPHSA